MVFLFIGGASIPIYLILWIALPAARTSAQKLEMRGEDVTISTIEKKIRDERQDDGKPFSGGHIRNFFNEIFSALAKVFKVGLKVIGGFLSMLILIKPNEQKVPACLLLFFGPGCRSA